MLDFNYDTTRKTITQALGISSQRAEELDVKMEEIKNKVLYKWHKSGIVDADEIIEPFIRLANEHMELIYLSYTAGRLIEQFIKRPGLSRDKGFGILDILGIASLFDEKLDKEKGASAAKETKRE